MSLSNHMIKNPTGITSLFLNIVIAINLLRPSSLQGKTSSIESYVRESCEQNIFSGDLLVVKGGTTELYLGCSEGRITSKTGFQYKIGSITKVFTAALILKLQSLEYLDIDKPVKNYISDFEYGAITPRDILMHRSGLVALDDIVNLEFLVDEPPDFLSDIIISYGQRGIYRYSNYGYQVLGKLISTVTGKEYADAIDLYLDVDLDGTSIGERKGLEGTIHTPFGTVSSRNLSMLKEYTWRHGADGALHSTLEDIVKLFDSLRNPIYHPMWEFPGRRTYSLGFSKRYIKESNQYVFGHNGALSPIGFTAFAYENQKGDRIFLLSNVNYNAQLDTFYDNLWNLLSNKQISEHNGHFSDINLGSVLAMITASRPDIWIPFILTIFNLLHLGRVIKAKDSLARRIYEFVCLAIFVSVISDRLASYLATALFLTSTGFLLMRSVVPTNISSFSRSEKLMYCFSFLTSTPILIVAIAIVFNRF